MNWRKIALALLIPTGLSLSAQPQMDEDMTVEQRAKKQTVKMAEALELTEDQEAKVLAVNLEQMTKADAMRQEQKKDREEMRAIMEEHDQEMKEILTEEQYKKFKTLREKRFKKMRHKKRRMEDMDQEMRDM